MIRKAIDTDCKSQHINREKIHYNVMTFWDTVSLDEAEVLAGRFKCVSARYYILHDPEKLTDKYITVWNNFGIDVSQSSLKVGIKTKGISSRCWYSVSYSGLGSVERTCIRYIRKRNHKKILFHKLVCFKPFETLNFIPYTIRYAFNSNLNLSRKDKRTKRNLC